MRTEIQFRRKRLMDAILEIFGTFFIAILQLLFGPIHFDF